MREAVACQFQTAEWILLPHLHLQPWPALQHERQPVKEGSYKKIDTLGAGCLTGLEMLTCDRDDSTHAHCASGKVDVQRMRPHGKLPSVICCDCVGLSGTGTAQPIPFVTGFQSPFAADRFVSKSCSSNNFTHDVHFWKRLRCSGCLDTPPCCSCGRRLCKKGVRIDDQR